MADGPAGWRTPGEGSAASAAMPAARPALLLAVLAASANVTLSTLCNNASFTSWFDSVVAEYERGKPPQPRPLLALSLHLRHVTLLERDDEARFTGDLYFDWNDNRLTWNATEWGCNTTQQSVDLLWSPDINLVIPGARRNGVADTPPARLSADGAVTAVSRIDISMPIALQLASWPGDTQSLELKFASGSILPDDFKLAVKKRQFPTPIKPAGAWKVVSVSTTVKSEPSELAPEILELYHDVVVVKVEVARRAPAHGLATLAVLLAVVVELAAATLLPPDLRTPLCACAAFTAALWLSSSLVRLPSATSTPLALYLMGVVCISAAVASLTAALAGRVARLKVTPPALVRRVLTGASGLCELMPDQSTSDAESGAWAAASRLLDLVLTSLLRLALLLVLAVYVFS